MRIISRYTIDQTIHDDWVPQSLLHDCKSPLPPQPPVISAVPHTLRPHPSLISLPLNSDYVVACVPSASDVAVLSQDAYQLLGQLPLSDDTTDPTTIRSVEHMHTLRLLTNEMEKLPEPQSSHTLVVWLHMTNACNLNCSYCYIRKSKEHMNRRIAYAAIDTVIRSARQHGYRHIFLKYAGGEPLLSLPLIAEIHTYAQQQAAQHSLHLQAGLLSNGTLLTASALDRIRELDIELMVSLDGVTASHDQQRPRWNGKGSLQATQHGIEQTIQAGIIPQIAITVTSQNIDDAPSLVAWLLEQQLPFTINFYRQPPSASDHTYEAWYADEQRIIDGMRAVYSVVEQQPPRWNVLGALLDRTDLSAAHQRTCAVGENYLVIDHHGRIAKCQMTLDQPLSHVQNDDPLTILRSDQIGVQNLPVDQKFDCRTCEWRYWCAGGCPIATYQATGQFDLKSPNCRIYKQLYPDLLRLEGLRLLHWATV